MNAPGDTPKKTALDKALEVLFALESGPVALGEIAARVGQPKPTVHRALKTWVRHGVVRHEDDGRYAIGLRLATLVARVGENEPLMRATRPTLRALAARTGHTAFLVVAENGALRVRDLAEGRGMLRATPGLGELVPVEHTAAGRLYRALAPAAIGGDADEARDVRTERAGRRGYALNDGEWRADVVVHGAPLLAHGRLVGVLALALPKAAGADGKAMAALVCEAAADVSRAL